MQVLIVDDEDTVREGLKAVIDWKAQGFSICGEGVDGEDGLNKIQKINPELVLLDIKMPVMGGIEVAERARKAGFPGKIIILSGYSDFKYAQRAIRQGVIAYLLKPIDEDELIEAVSMARSEIEAEALVLAMDQEKQKLVRGSVLGDILQGRRSLDEYKNTLGMNNGIYKVAAVECKDASLLHELRDVGGDIEPVFVGGKDFFILKGTVSESTFRRAIKSRFKKLNDIGAFISLGSAVKSFDNIRKSYSEALYLLENKFLMLKENEIVYTYEYCAQAMNSESAGFSEPEWKGKLSLCITFGETKTIYSLMQDLLVYCRCSGMGVQKVKGLLADFYNETVNAIRREYPQFSKEIPNYIVINNKIYENRSLEGVIQWFTEDFCRFSALVGCRSFDSVVMKMKHYVDQYYYLNINLESLADIFGYNSAYLGRIFRNSVGESFNSYIDNVMITNAKSYLESTNLKVYEISEKVGFSSYIYFYRKFVKYTGKSPNEYRKLFNENLNEG